MTYLEICASGLGENELAARNTARRLGWLRRLVVVGERQRSAQNGVVFDAHERVRVGVEASGGATRLCRRVLENALFDVLLEIGGRLAIQVGEEAETQAVAHGEARVVELILSGVAQRSTQRSQAVRWRHSDAVHQFLLQLVLSTCATAVVVVDVVGVAL